MPSYNRVGQYHSINLIEFDGEEGEYESWPEAKAGAISYLQGERSFYDQPPVQVKDVKHAAMGKLIAYLEACGSADECRIVIKDSDLPH